MSEPGVAEQTDSPDRSDWEIKTEIERELKEFLGDKPSVVREPGQVVDQKGITSGKLRIFGTDYMQRSNSAMGIGESLGIRIHRISDKVPGQEYSTDTTYVFPVDGPKVLSFQETRYDREFGSPERHGGTEVLQTKLDTKELNALLSEVRASKHIPEPKLSI